MLKFLERTLIPCTVDARVRESTIGRVPVSMSTDTPKRKGGSNLRHR